ncbi:unnamed protein product [Parnassius mnemosyne]|uniref:Reverse transcriptase domain-containing protein n=1 Tax=Parnassius mnemosyne TaxID=213953 RepID=A0AAV1L2X2_9NEOP
MQLAKALSCTIQNCFTNSENSWQKLFTFAYSHFHFDKTINKSITSQLKETSFQNLDYPINTDLSQPRPKFDLKKVVESKVMDGDLKNASRILFSDDILAPRNVETLESLRQKHPSVKPSQGLPLPPKTSMQPLQISEKDTLEAIMSFSNGSAGGIDGITPQHLKDLVSASAGDAGGVLLKDITKLCNFMLSGNVNPNFIPFLYGARLCAFKKKDNGIRPIAVGSTFRRLTSKLACRYIISNLKTKFQPTQLGFGTRGGCEAAVHSVRTFLTNSDADVLVKVDLRNAFNSIDRVTLLKEVANNTPEIYHYVWQCYSQNTNLFYENHVIDSAVGVQQGDPLGPALFSLGIQPIISNLKSKLNVWYLDDGTLGGRADDVLSDLTHIFRNFKNIGLEPNSNKCEIFFSNNLSTSHRDTLIQNFNHICPGIKTVNTESLYLLGAPLFFDSIKPVLKTKFDQFLNHVDKLYKLNPHIALTILKYCLLVPRFTYLLRSSPVWKCSDILQDIDNNLKIAIEKILNLTLNTTAWTQATLPIKFGGIGVRNLSSVALPAFLASVHSVSDLCNIILNNKVDLCFATEAGQTWQTLCPGENIPLEVNQQKQWDIPLVQGVQKDLFHNFHSDQDKARLLAVSTKESSHWLHALPSSNLGTLLDRESLRIAVGIRLGAAICQPHQCPCGNSVDKFGLHGLSCKKSAGRFSRHSSLNDVIRRALASINVPSVLEPCGIFRDDGKRPDGMTLVPWERGKALVWDATCVDTLAASHLRGTSFKAGAASEAAELSKWRKYESLRDDYIFVPFAVETIGPWGSRAVKFLKELHPRLVVAAGDKRAGSFLAQRLSIAIQRGNAASVLGTMPRGVGLYDN